MNHRNSNHDRNTNRNNMHVREILNNIPKESFQLVKTFNNCVYIHNKGAHQTNRTFSNGVAVVKNNKLAGRLEDVKLLESLEPESRKRFLREGKILSAINYKNIPQVYDILEYEDWLLFRYEHVEGYSLKEVLDYLKKKKVVFPKYAATSIIFKLLNALYYAHNEVRYEGQKKSIIHCDIKPSNIILCVKDYSRKGNLDEKFITLLKQNKVEPFLIDFGVAKFRGKTSIEGTVNYLSPAQISKRKLDWRTDIYQLMLVYNELLTLVLPYSGLSRNKILEEKLKRDFSLDKTSNINGSIKDFIEKGTKRDSSKSFKSEKECIKILSVIESRQKKLDFFRKYKKSILIMAVVIICLVLSFFIYKIWDYQTQSVDAIVRGIENNPNPTITELEAATARIQTRAFEKKYYEPLIRGEFRDIKTGKPLYPSHLDISGNWVLVGPETESAGMFVGLLFDYSKKYPEKYPKLLAYAKEYAEPILDSEFDGSSEKRYMYALIPGYETTHDERYLKKLINVSEMLIYYSSVESGSTQCNDMYQEKLFLYVYNKTGTERYLAFYKLLVKSFVKANIDSDGYIYLSVDSEKSSDNSIQYHKWGRLVEPVGTYLIGGYFENNNDAKFKNVSSLFSRDFVEVLITLQDMYAITNDTNYNTALNKTAKYYISNLPSDKLDYLFVSSVKKENSIPKDTLAAVKSLYFFEKDDSNIYREKLNTLLSKEYFKKENEEGILTGSVVIESMFYDNSDLKLRNQSLIETDALFLELK